jgi:hypothetical protein
MVAAPPCRCYTERNFPPRATGMLDRWSRRQLVQGTGIAGLGLLAGVRAVAGAGGGALD